MDAQVISAVLVAVIVSVLAPLVMGWMKGQAEKDAIERAAAQREKEKADARALRDQEAVDRRAEKQQDWDRQDVVADRAAQAASRLLESQQVLAQKADVTTRMLADYNGTITDQLKVLDDGQKIIHGLVNSTLTASMQADLDGKRLLLLALKRNAAIEPAVVQDSQDLMVITEAKIEALEAALTERAEQQKLVDAQLQQQHDDRVMG